MKHFIRFIKRLCYRVSKRLIRFFIYFNIFVCLLVSSVSAQNIYEYKDMQTLAEGGNLTAYISNTLGSISELKYNINDFQSWNDITISDDATFKSAFIRVSDAPNVNLEFNNGDVVYLRQKVVTNINKNTHNSKQSTIDNFSITFENESSSGVSQFTSSVGSSIVRDVSFGSGSSYDVVTYYLDGFVRLPNFNGHITSMSYSFEGLSTGTLQVRIYPQSSNDKITYFVGQKDDAPSYGTIDSSNVDKYHSDEQKILDEVFKNDPVGKANQFFTDFQWFFNNDDFHLPSCFSAWSLIFNDLAGYGWFHLLLSIGLTLGMFGFIFSVARDGLSGNFHFGKDRSTGSTIASERSKYLGD